MSSTLLEVEFEPIEEHWNTYVLEDSTKVRARVILLKLLTAKLPLFTTSQPSAQIQFKTSYIFVVSARPELKGPPGPPLTQEEISSIIRGEGQLVRIRESDEKWNVYRIINSGETLKLKLVVSDVYRVPDRFDPDGEPIYVFTHTTTFMPGPLRPLSTP
jgi:hypothetical protein